MRALLTTAHGDRSVLQLDENFEDPQPAPGEVVVAIAATAVNFHDIFTRRGMPGIQIGLPVIVGSDIAGHVIALGPDVDAQWEGKRVLIDPIFRDGKRHGMIGETCHGGRAERIAVSTAQLIEIPDGVSLDHAATLPLAYGTAWRMMVTRGRIAKDETVLVLGASGGVGVACVQIARLFGANVIACASSDSKAERLKAIGAEHVVNYAERPFREAVHEIIGKPRMTGKGGVDVAVNFTGGDTFVDTQKCTRLGGRILTCGATAGYDVSLDARYWWTFEHDMIGSNGWGVSDLEALLAAIDEGRLEPVIDQRLPLEQSAEAERLLEDREVVGKVLIVP
ncbi:zinc-binding dehydrogenase [Marinobacter salarius]|uniref:zinc-binding dehydrogenase n=1 Tax=Marinobacter salarius TaxID=1420917 RepID=UPI0032ECFAAB